MDSNAKAWQVSARLGRLWFGMAHDFKVGRDAVWRCGISWGEVGYGLELFQEVSHEQEWGAMDVILEVKDRASLVDVVSEYTSLKKRGSRWIGLCPLHAERTPSFSVDEDKQLFHCFGCNTGGDVITFLMKADGLTFRQALEKLCERHGIPYTEFRGARPLPSRPPRVTNPNKWSEIVKGLVLCPFCGSGGDEVLLITRPCFYVHCYHCSADGPVTQEAIDATALWNRRYGQTENNGEGENHDYPYRTA